MRKYVNLKIRSEVFLTLILLLFSLIGYVPTWPYFLSNSILILLPIIVILNLNRIRFTNNSIAFITVFLIISIIPYIVNSSEMFKVKTEQKIFVESLKIFGVIFAFILGSANSLKYKDLCRILFIIFILNFVLMSIQFFVLRPVIFSNKGEWIDVVQPKVFWKRQVVGICGNANTVGSFVLIVIAIIYDWLKQNRKLLLGTMILSIIAVVVYAKSRNNILVALLFFGYYLLFIKKRLKPVLNFFIFSVVFSIAVLFSAGSEVTDSIFRFSSFSNKLNSLTVRIMINKEAFVIWWKHLLFFGGGFGSEPFSMAKFHASRLYSEMLYTKYLIEMGIVGTVFSVSFIYVLYKNKLREAFQKRVFKTILFVVIFVSFFETVFYSQQLFYFMIFITGWLSTHTNEDESPITLKNNFYD